MSSEGGAPESDVTFQFDNQGKFVGVHDGRRTAALPSAESQKGSFGLCPFCGAQEPTLTLLSRRWWQQMTEVIRFFVFCGECRAMGPESDTQGGARNAWNRRAALFSVNELRKLAGFTEIALDELPRLRPIIEEIPDTAPEGSWLDDPESYAPV